MKLEELSRLIEEAIAQRVPVMMKYHGGSQPGSKRWVLPLSIAQTKLRARDLKTDEAKTFALNKIELIHENDPAPDYIEKAHSATPLADALKSKVDELISLGWRVVLTDESIELFEADNEKPTAWIKPNYSSIFSMTIDISSITETNTEERDGWSVFGPSFAAQIVDAEPDDDVSFGYKRLGSALEAFLKEARRYSPKKNH